MHCNKQTYASHRQAKYAAKKIKASGGNSKAGRGLTLRPYRCDVCGLWHLTKNVNQPAVERGRR